MISGGARRALLPLVCLVALLPAAAVRSATVTVIQGDSGPIFEQIRISFTAAFQQLEDVTGSLAARQVTVVRLDRVEAAHAPYALRQEMRSSRPDLIVVIGSEAWQAVMDFLPAADTPPILFCLVGKQGLDTRMQAPERVSGIRLLPAPAEVLDFYRSWFPGRRLSVIYDPASFGYIVDEFKQAQISSGIRLDCHAIGSVHEIPRVFSEVLPAAEGLLVFPSWDVYPTYIVRAIFREAAGRGIPAFSPRVTDIDNGALFTITPDWQSLGPQLADLAARGLAQHQLRNLPPVSPGKLVYTVNRRIYSLLGYKIPADGAALAVWRDADLMK
ncbi:hypothetical protein JW905_10050 [bacterium]|nr:hypothetical protein [candidate division CSSED10-310 bacterium]